jgi:hypothetical protein
LISVINILSLEFDKLFKFSKLDFKVLKLLSSTKNMLEFAEAVTHSSHESIASSLLNFDNL